jgi:hypothetical protein
MVIKTLQDTELAEEAKQIREINLIKTNEECEKLMNSVKVKFNEREKLYQEIFDKQQTEIEQSNIKKLEEQRRKYKLILEEERELEKQRMLTILSNEITAKRNQMMNDLTSEITEFRKNKVDKINRELFEWVETSRKSKLEEIEESLYSIALQNIQEKITTKQKEMMNNI